ncbi:glycosyltransferase [Microbacterium atlanticum]|uniref:glycosyltransferase n=1 Tax=Microbacterium atlanticum TaxID=2782168 RepID=UPI001888DA47|nr:glycosyltransferase [Microbacterium atlanticum]
MTVVRASASPLAPGRQVAVTWGIPDRFGGMTSALLRRSRLFAQTGAATTVVTLEDRPDYDVVRARLRERGELEGGVELRNIYEDFRIAHREPIDAPAAPAAPARPADDEAVSPAGAVHRWREGAEVVRVEHRRADGSLAVLESRPHPEAAKRTVTTFDPAGRPTGRWSTVRRFRLAWLDEVLGGAPAILVVDSKVAARVLQHYRRRHVTLIHLVHGAHTDRAGRLTPLRREVFEHLDRWDAVAFLTDRQRLAAMTHVGDGRNFVSVSNVVTIPERMPRLPPDRLHGVIASGLSRRKRIEHALEAVARVRALGVPVTLEVVGDGPQRRPLEAEARRLGLAEAVTFTGYSPRGAERFRDGAWTLLTSRSEGESLSLLEAMGAGCLPIAYDIPYGPADAIHHGRSGYLIPDADVAGVASALIALCELDEDRLAAMRSAARQVAQGYGPDAVLSKWGRAQAAAVRRHAERQPPPPPLLRRAAGRVSRAAARALRGSRRRPR